MRTKIKRKDGLRVNHEKQSNALPFETKMGFTALPIAVCKYYVRHPKFTPAVERVYRYLLQRYNAEKGYAWPSWSTIMRETNIGSRQTIKRAIEALEYLELIKRMSHEWGNNFYVFLPPIEDEAEFMRKFGGEIERSQKKTVEQREQTETDEFKELADWL